MAGSHQRSESKRKLFRAITSRISLHNHALPTIERDDLKDEKKEEERHQSPAILHNRHRHTQSQSPPLLSHTGAPSGNLSVNGITHTNGQNQVDYHGSHVDYQKNDQGHNSRDVHSRQSEVCTIPVTQGNDSQNFSYLDSIKKAPTKKHPQTTPQHMQTPTVTNSKIRNFQTGAIVGDSNVYTQVKGNNETSKASQSQFGEPDNVVGYDSHHVTETTTTCSDISYVQKIDTVVTSEKNRIGINEYDYKTFSTGHPLRLSKVKAFEQAELTTKLHFSKLNSAIFDDYNEISNVEIRKRIPPKSDYIYHDNKQEVSSVNRANENDSHVDVDMTTLSDSSDDEIILQIPQLSEDESRSLLGYAPLKITSNDIESGRYGVGRHAGNGPSSVEQRILAMKNALRPLSREEVMESRLQYSTLTTAFQNTSEFLKSMEPPEIDSWEAMNEDFEKDMQEIQEYRRLEQEERRKLVPDETIQAVTAALKHSRRVRRRNVAAETAVSNILRKRVKDHFRSQLDGALG